MTTEQITQLKTHIVFINEFYKHPPMSDMVVKMYASDLEDLSFDEVVRAYEIYRRNPKNTRAPLPAAIREIICPEVADEDVAISTAGNVVQAVSKYGWSNSTDARVFIGELGWAAVQRFGGWQYVCENLGRTIQLGQFQAQIRDSMKSDIKVIRAGGALPALDYKYQDPDALLNDNKQKQITNLISIMSNGKGMK
jgi:hypothetical protein